TFRRAETAPFVAFWTTLIVVALPAAPLVFAPLASLTGVDGLYAAPLAPAIGTIESVFLVDRHRISQNRFRPVIAVDAEQARLILVAPRVAAGTALTAILVGKRGVMVVRLPALRRVPSVTGLAEKAGLSDVERRYML